jgi:hypothetical protein
LLARALFKRRVRGWIAVVASGCVASAGCLAFAACSSSAAAPAAGTDASADDPSSDDDGGADADDGARPPTYTAVYEQVLEPNCALPFCHAGSGDYLQLASMAVGYASLVDAAAQGPDCAKLGLNRVDPGHPETSLLYLKITNPPCGAKMPRFYGEGGSLEPADIQQIEQWITLGALNN